MTRRAMRLALAVATTSISVLASGCLSSTAVQPSLLDLKGEWIYTSEQSGLIPENLTGTLVVSSESGTAFQGRLDVVGVNQQTGQSRWLSGSVSGTGGANGVIDFEASIETASRRHVGQMVADTITGSWVRHSSDGIITGTFRAERESR